MEITTIQAVSSIAAVAVTAFTGWLTYRIRMTDKKMRAEAQANSQKHSIRNEDRHALRKLEEEVRKAARADNAYLQKQIENLREELEEERTQKYQLRAEVARLTEKVGYLESELARRNIVP